MFAAASVCNKQKRVLRVTRVLCWGGGGDKKDIAAVRPREGNILALDSARVCFSSLRVSLLRVINYTRGNTALCIPWRILYNKLVVFFFQNRKLLYEVSCFYYKYNIRDVILYLLMFAPAGIDRVPIMTVAWRQRLFSPARDAKETLLLYTRKFQMHGMRIDTFRIIKFIN